MDSEKQRQVKNEHKLKVYSCTTGSAYSYREDPQIRIQGKWLSEARFEPGTTMSVVCEAGKLIIETIK